MATMIRAATAEDYGAFARLFPELGTNDPIVEQSVVGGSR